MESKETNQSKTLSINLKALNQPVKLADIDFRIQSINKGKYATILAYKDARYDMNLLDEVVGAQNWQKDFKIIDGKLYCGVAIRSEGEWVWKWDVGTESDVEKAKGEASDAFKRACFNWGVGRELYSFPKISVKLEDSEVDEVQGKFRQSFGLKLSEWKWDMERTENGEIIRLTAHDQNGKLRFNSNPSKTAYKPSSPAPSTSTPPAQKEAVKASNAMVTEAQTAEMRKIVSKMQASPEKSKVIAAMKDGKVTEQVAQKLIDAKDIKAEINVHFK